MLRARGANKWVKRRATLDSVVKWKKEGHVLIARSAGLRALASGNGIGGVCKVCDKRRSR